MNLNFDDLSEQIDIYYKLLELIKRRDSSFILIFQSVFPNFSIHLLKINSNLTLAEIEFCALIKMKLTTKQIADLKYCEVRTIQNKKNAIRKKLYIPSGIDIYNWIDNIKLT